MTQQTTLQQRVVQIKSDSVKDADDLGPTGRKVTIQNVKRLEIIINISCSMMSRADLQAFVAQQIEFVLEDDHAYYSEEEY